MKTSILRWALSWQRVSLVLCCLTVVCSNSKSQANQATPAEAEKIRVQLNKLRILEAKNLEKIGQYANNPTAQIKLKSNLVIIRLKISTLLEQLESGSGAQDTSKSTGTGNQGRPSEVKGSK